MADEIVVLTGIKETLDALKAFDKDAVKRFNKVINDNLAGAERDARASVDRIFNSKTDTPMSGWRASDAMKPTSTRGGAGWPGWDRQAVKAGIRKTKAQGKVRRRDGSYTTSAGALLNESAAGAIFEVAGRKPKGSNKNGFVTTLNERFGVASRTIWRTVDRDRIKIQANVSRALEEAKIELQKHLNKERA
jgi:hypothetical protein